MSLNEKLTLQALKDHDKVHPKYAAVPKDKRHIDDSKVSVSSRRSHASGDHQSLKSDKTGKSKSPAKINFFRIVAATQAWRRLAKTRSTPSERLPSRPVVRYENSYRTEPEPGSKFSPVNVEEMLKDTLEQRLKSVKYTSETTRRMATELTAEIKSKVKAMDFPRYKIVCSVFISENKCQGLEIASRSVWNHDTDNFASYTYRNTTLIAVANVYGVYFE